MRVIAKTVRILRYGTVLASLLDRFLLFFTGIKTDYLNLLSIFHIRQRIQRLLPIGGDHQHQCQQQRQQAAAALSHSIVHISLLS